MRRPDRLFLLFLAPPLIPELLVVRVSAAITVACLSS